MKFGHGLASPPTVTPGPTYQSSRSISGASRSVPLAALTIFACYCWLQQSFEAKAISEVTDLCSGERENTIYVNSRLSGSILTFFIQFKFYPIKQSRFEKLSSPIFLEFNLIFYIIFPVFFQKFQI
jgi:hypothetical protein